jgi:hypothetical protein
MRQDDHSSSIDLPIFMVRTACRNKGEAIRHQAADDVPASRSNFAIFLSSTNPVESSVTAQ